MRKLQVAFVLMLSFASSLHADTGLIEATKRGHTAQVIELLNADADVNFRDEIGFAALHHAVRAGSSTIVDLLLERGADVDIRDRYDSTALHHAARAGSSALVELLLKRGADVDAREEYGFTALHRAAGDGSSAVEDLLLEQGADPNARSELRITPLFLASRNGAGIGVIDSLINAGADLDTAGPDGETPLMAAARNGHTAIAELLISRGANVLATDDDGITALFYALESGSGGIVAVIRDAGGFVLPSRKSASAGLLAAATGGLSDLLIPALDAGADINVRGEKGRTALVMSVLSGDTPTVMTLLERGADVSLADNRGRTPLHYAAAGDGSDLCWIFCAPPMTIVVEALIAAGADVDAIDRSGETPLHCASARGHIGSIALLIEAGAKLDVRSEEGQTPLQLAAMNEPSTVEFLIDKGTSTLSRDVTVPAILGLVGICLLSLALLILRSPKRVTGWTVSRLDPWKHNSVAIVVLALVFGAALHLLSRAEYWHSRNSWHLMVDFVFVGSGTVNSDAPGYPRIETFSNKSDCENASLNMGVLPAPPPDLRKIVRSTGLQCKKTHNPAVWSKLFLPFSALTALMAGFAYSGRFWAGFVVVNAAVGPVGLSHLFGYSVFWGPYILKGPVAIDLAIAYLYGPAFILIANITAAVAVLARAVFAHRSV